MIIVDSCFMAVQRVTTNPLVETTTPNEWLVCHWLLGFQTPPQLKAVAHQVHKIGSGDVSHVELLKTCCFWISHSNFGRNCKNRIRKFKSQVLISSPYPWWWNSNQEETRTPHTLFAEAHGLFKKLCPWSAPNSKQSQTCCKTSSTSD